MKPAYKYLAIEGVIGAGKTTLAKMLAEDYSAKLLLEEFATNSFLERFYKDQERYAFPVEVGFLAERFRQLEAEFGPDLFSDLTISDYHFAKSNVFARITLSKEHYQIFRNLFDIFIKRLPKNDVMLYLNNSVEGYLQNIKKRNRQMESPIEPAYLQNLKNGYTDFIKRESGYPILVLEMEGKDFVKDAGVYQAIKELLSQEFSAGIHSISL